jgi:hypothetical protein
MAQQRPHLIALDERRLATRLRRSANLRWTAAMGHEERFPLPRLSDRYGFSKETFARVPGSYRDAPKGAVRGATIEPLESTQSRPCRFQFTLSLRDCSLAIPGKKRTATRTALRGLREARRMAARRVWRQPGCPLGAARRRSRGLRRATPPHAFPSASGEPGSASMQPLLAYQDAVCSEDALHSLGWPRPRSKNSSNVQPGFTSRGGSNQTVPPGLGCMSGGGSVGRRVGWPVAERTRKRGPRP